MTEKKTRKTDNHRRESLVIISYIRFDFENSGKMFIKPKCLIKI